MLGQQPAPGRVVSGRRGRCASGQARVGQRGIGRDCVGRLGRERPTDRLQGGQFGDQRRGRRLGMARFYIARSPVLPSRGWISARPERSAPARDIAGENVCTTATAARARLFPRPLAPRAVPGSSIQAVYQGGFG
ncbi:hypothetical protein GLE_4787 [Lysobacter enzymogenes]|uniref:Uncharacterized protein n=1 Tax=Lysobacter enzymogenes TaxID=69 RepID=A0A0S2DNQ7_LYSEN|nr:hypothetical protein GLE_4787 [Lysobacter enzymogenes]